MDRPIAHPWAQFMSPDRLHSPAPNTSGEAVSLSKPLHALHLSGRPRVRKLRPHRVTAAPLKISVITATKNSVDTLAECLASVHRQSYGHHEHIIIDGASTDGTLAELEKCRDHLDVLVSEPDQGIYHALNKGLARASGDIVGFLNSDDLYADPHVLRRVAAAFADPAVEAIYGDLLYVKRRDPGQVIRYWRSCAFSRSLLHRGWMPPHPTLYLRREVYDRIGGFNPTYQIAADYDLMLRLLSQPRGKVVYLPNVMVHMRLGGVSNRSLFSILRKSWEDYRALRANRVGGLVTLALKNLSKVSQFFFRPAVGVAVGYPSHPALAGKANPKYSW